MGRVRVGQPGIGWKPVWRWATTGGSLSLMGRSALAPSGSIGAVEERDSRTARARELGEGPDVLLEREQEEIKG